MNRLNITVVLFVVLANCAILGLILGIYATAHEKANIAPQLLTIAGVSAGVAAWLGLRLRSHKGYVQTDHALPLYSVCILISIVVPLMGFLIFNQAQEILELGTLLTAQSAFMVSVMVVKLRSVRHRF